MDKINSNTRRAFRAASDRFSRPYFGDIDRDGVPNILDCQPTNRHKQGFLHDWLDKRKQAKEEESYLEGDEPVDGSENFVQAENDVNEEPMRGAEPRGAFVSAERKRETPSSENEEKYENYDAGYFIKKRGIYVYEPFGYLAERYGVPREESKNMTMLFGTDSQGRHGALKQQLDSIGQQKQREDNIKKTRRDWQPKSSGASPAHTEEPKKSAADDYISKLPRWNSEESEEETEVTSEEMNETVEKRDRLKNQYEQSLQEKQEEPKRSSEDLMDKTYNAMKREETSRPPKKETPVERDVSPKKGTSPENPEGFYNPEKKGRFGGSEGQIYLYVKTEPNAYSLFGTPFNSRVEASRYAEENFKGSKFLTMSKEELKDYMDTKKEEKKEEPKSSDILKNVLEQSQKKAEREGLTAPQLGGGFGGFSGGSAPMYRPTPYSPTPSPMFQGPQRPRSTPGVSSGILRKPQPQFHKDAGKKAHPTIMRAPFVQYTGPHFRKPDIPRGRPYQKKPQSKYTINTDFKLYRPPIYGSRGNVKSNTPISQNIINKKPKGGHPFMAKKKTKKRSKRKK